MQKKFLKWLLGINKYCTNNACRASTGRFPMKINAQCRNFEFWLSLINIDLALINRAGGLYGRILTEVASTPRSRFSHTDWPSVVNKMFIIWPNKKAKEQKHHNFYFISNLPTFACFLYLLPREGPLILRFSIINRNKPIFFIFFVCNFLRTTVTTRSV